MTLPATYNTISESAKKEPPILDLIYQHINTLQAIIQDNDNYVDDIRSILFWINDSIDCESSQLEEVNSWLDTLEAMLRKTIDIAQANKENVLNVKERLL
jgi:chromosome segregation ATPase